MKQQNFVLRKGKPRHRGPGWPGESQRHSEAARKGYLKKFAKKKITDFAVDKAMLIGLGPQYAALRAVGYGLEKAGKFSRLQKKVGTGKAVVAVTSDLVKDEIIEEGKGRITSNLNDNLEALKSKKRKNDFEENY